MATTATTTSSYAFIRPLDLKDPTLILLNQKFQDLQSQVTNLTNASSSTATSAVASGWAAYVPTVTTSMTTDFPYIFEAQYLKTANQVFVNIDIQFNLSGSASDTITLSVPTGATPASSSGNLMPAIAFNTSAAQVYARAINGAIEIKPYTGNFALTTCELIVSGWYRI